MKTFTVTVEHDLRAKPERVRSTVDVKAPTFDKATAKAEKLYRLCNPRIMAVLDHNDAPEQVELFVEAK